MEYPTQKPIKLLERIIQVSSNEKDIVLDPFCRSGTTLLAADNLYRRWIEIDKSKTACKIARDRLERRRKSDQLVEKGGQKITMSITHRNTIASNNLI